MAIGAIAAFNGLMLELAGRQRVIMAVQTKRIPPGDEQFFIQRGMRLVTALAITVRKRRMTDLADQQISFDLGVAVKADLTGLAAHPVRELRLVANATLAPGIGRMHHRGRQFDNGTIRRLVLRDVIRVNDKCHPGRGIGGAGLRHTIKENIQPFLPVIRAAPRQQRQSTGQSQPGGPAAETAARI